MVVQYGTDVHFLLRHDDGTWSQKLGGFDVTNYSAGSSSFIITDDNISTAISNSGYTDGTRYFLIKKPPIIDYPHRPSTDNSLYAETIFSDTAGNYINNAAAMEDLIPSTSGRFDYSGDYDYYVFVPDTSDTYEFTTSLASNYDVDISIYDNFGNLIARDNAVGAPDLFTYLSAGSRYFVRVNCAAGSIIPYTLYIET